MAQLTTPNGAIVDSDTGQIITPAPIQPVTTPQTNPAPQTTQQPSLSVTSYKDNPDGTTTNTLSDGSTDTGKLSQNPDGSYSFSPTSSTQATTTPPPAAQPYMGNSIVDYLNHNGSASDFASRTALAKQYGIPNYSGTAAQNTSLLNTLRKNQGGLPNNPATNPTGNVGESGAINNQNKTGTDPYAGMSPVQKQVKMYQDAYTSLGLGTIKDQFDKFTKQYNDLTKELADKIDEKNNNPWLSATSRAEEVKKIQDSYSTKLDAFSKLATLTDSMYKAGIAQVDHLVSDANADIKATNDLAQKQIDAANALAKDNQVVTIGNREVLVNKATGKVVADLGPTKPTAATAGEKDASAASNISNQLTSAVGADGYTDPNLYARLRAKSTLSASDFDNRFGYLVNPQSTARLGIGNTSTGGNVVSDAQLKQFINKQIATPEFKKLSSDKQKEYIQSQGGNPSDFGI